MKTVMKKLLSLALVAILLVSAVPFQASADETDISVPVSVFVNDTFTSTKYITMKSGETKALTEELGMSLLDVTTNRSFVKWVASVEGDLNYDWLKDNLSTYSLALYIKDTTHVHSYTKDVITKVPTCTTSGEKAKACECGAIDPDSKTRLPANGHNYGDVVLNTSNNKNTQTCKDCGDVIEVSSKAHTITFYVDSSTSFTRYWNDNQYVTELPIPALASKFNFLGWYTKANGEGTKLETPFTWEKNQDMTYYAYYQENPAGDKDSVSSLEVRMKLYDGDGIAHDETLLEVELKDGTYLLSWLYANEATIADKVFAKVSSSKYEWVNRIYFNNTLTAELTEADVIANGDKVVYIKVYLKDSQKTNVQLYIHQYNSSSKSYQTLKIVDVAGYKAGSTITFNKMKTIVDKYYKYKTIKGLYADTAWKQLVAGQNPTASTSLTVGDGSTVKYHVLLDSTAAPKSGSTSKADTTNPKTGDMILVPAMVMLASAAAVAFVYISSKKRAVR